MSKKTYW